MPLRYNFNIAAPIFIQLTPNKDAQLQQQLNDPPHTQKSDNAPAPSHSPHNTEAHPASHSASDATAPPSSTTSNDGNNTATTDPPMAKRTAHPKITPDVKSHLTTLLAEDRIGTATHLQEALARQVPPATLTRH